MRAAERKINRGELMRGLANFKMKHWIDNSCRRKTSSVEAGESTTKKSKQSQDTPKVHRRSFTWKAVQPCNVFKDY